MERDIIEVIKSKSFFELDSSEKIEIKDYCANEDEFNELKHAFLAIESNAFSSVKPSLKTKKSLDNMFTQKYPQAAPIWYNSLLTMVVRNDKPIFKQPLVQIAAVVVLLFLAIPIFNSGLKNDKVLISENKVGLTEKEFAKEDSVKIEEEAPNLEVEKNEQEDALITIPQEGLAFSSEVESIEFDIAENEVTSNAQVNEDIMSAAFSEPVSSHPDGVFIAPLEENSAKRISISVADSEDLMDLLVATF